MTPLPPAHVFAHEAMNTTFQLRILASQAGLAGDMAYDCFEQLDFLESRLSRYIEGSDVSRINSLQPGETLYLSEATHRCLLAAVDAHLRTGGLFDITLGSRIEHRKANAEGDMPPLAGRLTIHPDVPAVTCDAPGRVIDLGGIGKGFALDQLKLLLEEWGAEGGLLAAGASSLLAFGAEQWPVDLSGDGGAKRISLANQSLSASGFGIQGSHIIHPAGDGALPANPCRRLWVTARTATLAEIWSTALMLVDRAAILEFIAGDDTLGQVHVDGQHAVETLGDA